MLDSVVCGRRETAQHCAQGLASTRKRMQHGFPSLLTRRITARYVSRSSASAATRSFVEQHDMPDFDELSRLTLFDKNSPSQWLIALAVAIAVYIMLTTARRLIRGYYTRMRSTENVELLEIPLGVLSKTSALFFLVLSLYIGSLALVLGASVTRVLNSAITIALFWQAGVWAGAAAAAWIDRKRRQSMGVDRAAVGSLGVIGFMINVVIWALVVMLTLDNLGVDITALIAGLGIGGIAVALAVQNILGDLFASLSITLDRPFVVGDFLSVGEFLGSVEYIGIKSTRLRSLSGEQIVISNADLLASRVRNYGRMSERRVVFNISVMLDTPTELLERIPTIIRAIVEAQKDVRFDRSHFARYNAGSLEFETVYYVLSPEYNRYMDTQQQINLRLHRELAQLGARFAYPTQRLFVATTHTHEQGAQPIPAQS
jgi:small-conductance mechanosensitive channel